MKTVKRKSISITARWALSLGKTPSPHCPRCADPCRAVACRCLPLSITVLWRAASSGFCSDSSWFLLAFSPGFALVSTQALVSFPWSVLYNAPCCDRNSCALAAPSCWPGLPAAIISARLVMQPGRGFGGVQEERGEGQRYCLCCRALNTRHLFFLEATCQAKLKILNVIAVCFSKTHSQPSERDI